MYLYGAFLRMYQNDNNPNYFLEAGINYGKKKLLLDGLDETVDKKFLGDVGIGWVWIDQSIMLEASVNLKFLSHTYLDLNTMISEKTTTGYVQPQLAIFFYL